MKHSHTRAADELGRTGALARPARRPAGRTSARYRLQAVALRPFEFSGRGARWDRRGPLPYPVVAIFAFLVLPLTALAAPMTALAFSADVSTLASSGYGRVDLRSVEDGKVLQSVSCPFPRVTSVAFDEEGKLIAGGGVPGASGSAVIIDSKTKSTTRTFSGYQDLVTCVATSGEMVGLGSADHTATIYATTNTIQLIGHSGPVLAIALAPSGDLVLTASADRSIKTWSLKGEPLRSFNYHTEAVHALAFRPRSDSGPVECASTGADGTIRIWQPVIGRMVRIIRGHNGAIFSLAYTPDGEALYSAGREGIVRKIASDSDHILAEKSAATDAIYAVAISPDGHKLATGDWTGEVQLWNLKSGFLSPREP